MIRDEKDELTAKGLTAMEHGHFYLAQVCFERAAAIEKSPIVCSCLGFCMAATRQQFAQGIELCTAAIDKDPETTTHYLHLGRIYLMAGQRDEAINAFRQSFQYGRDQQIIRELDLLGTRRPPVIKSLKRDHPLNKYLGIIFSRLGLR